jgi:hypothetical protein
MIPWIALPSDDLTVPRAEGARVRESEIRRTITVPSFQAPNLYVGFRLAHASVAKGVPTKLRIRTGTYRESVLDLNWRQGKAADTLLVVEGVGRVVWTGSDPYPFSRWKRDGEYYSPSPLYAVRSRYPQFALSPEKRREWAWFVKWSGYTPEVYNAPTGD